MTNHEKLIADLAKWFRTDIGRTLALLFRIAEEMDLDTKPIQQVICAESLSLSAYAHHGGREAFLQMARDAYALAKTGELEQ
jgi:hypothetical protein